VAVPSRKQASAGTVPRMTRIRARLSVFVYWATTWFARVVLFTFARWTVTGREHLPAEGPLILVANHVHLLDPPLVGASATRRVRPMAKSELFETPLFGGYLRAYGGFPVRRFSADTGALRAARNYLREGDAVLMFPEGTRSRDGVLRSALSGAGMVALMTGAPVVPVAITGSNVHVPGALFQWLLRNRPRITVTFGATLDVRAALAPTSGEGRSAEVVTEQMMRAIAAMLPDGMQGPYGAGTTSQVVITGQRGEAGDPDSGRPGGPGSDAPHG